jgi:hypothetical protein
MAFRENIDCIDMTHLESFYECFRVKLFANLLAFGAGVKIQVNLAESVTGGHKLSPKE